MELITTSFLIWNFCIWCEDLLGHNIEVYSTADTKGVLQKHFWGQGWREEGREKKGRKKSEDKMEINVRSTSCNFFF